MLGEQYAELKGKITGQRVLDIDFLQQLKLDLSTSKALTASLDSCLLLYWPIELPWDSSLHYS
jgi:hypothetical protein